MASFPLVTCSFEDPECCTLCRQKNVGRFYKVVEGTEFCPKHGGPKVANDQKIQRANTYRLEQWQRRLREFSNDSEVKSLRDEIGILRIVLEGIMLRCKDKEELLMYSAKISDTAVKIEKLVTSCHRIEKNMGELMDKTTAIQFASGLLEIVTRFVKDADTLEQISAEILEELRTL